MNEKVIHYSNTKNIQFYDVCINIFIFMSLACFTSSLFLPVFFTSSEDVYGFWVLISGWVGAIFVQFAWYSNPVSLLALLLAREKPKIALLMSLTSLLLASSAFSFYEIPIGINYEKVFIKEFGLGFYLWFAAHCFVFIALLFRFSESLKIKRLNLDI